MKQKHIYENKQHMLIIELKKSFFCWHKHAHVCDYAATTYAETEKKEFLNEFCRSSEFNDRSGKFIALYN